MLVDAYRVFNTAIQPQKEDINGFFSTLDVDRDNQVRLQDLENLCIRYLTGSVMDREFKFTSMSQSLRPPPASQSGSIGQSASIGQSGGLGQGRFYNWPSVRTNKFISWAAHAGVLFVYEVKSWG